MPSGVPGYMADQGLVDIYVETAPPSSIEPTSPVELHTISSHQVDEKEGVWVSPTQDSFGWEEEEQLSEEEYWDLNPRLASADGEIMNIKDDGEEGRSVHTKKTNGHI